MTHNLPLLALLLLGLAVSTLLAKAPAMPASAFAVAAATPHAPTTPYGSGAAMRSLLF